MLDTEANQPSISLGISMVSVRAVVTLKGYQLCQVPDTVPNSKCELSSFLPACLVTQSCPTPCDPMDCSHQAPLSMGFPRQEHWRGLPCPPPGDLPNARIESVSPVSPALQADSSLLSQQGNLESLYR